MPGAWVEQLRLSTFMSVANEWLMNISLKGGPALLSRCDAGLAWDRAAFYRWTCDRLED